MDGNREHYVSEVRSTQKDIKIAVRLWEKIKKIGNGVKRGNRSAVHDQNMLYA